MRSKSADFDSYTSPGRAASDSREAATSAIDTDLWGNEWEDDDPAIDEDLFYD